MEDCGHFGRVVSVSTSSKYGLETAGLLARWRVKEEVKGCSFCVLLSVSLVWHLLEVEEFENLINF